jgi:hypothetical protein
MLVECLTQFQTVIHGSSRTSGIESINYRRAREEARGKVMRRTMKGVLGLWTAIVAGCGGWSAPQAAPGPVPLGPPGTTIARLKRENPSFETTFIEILWNDGRGAMKATDRVKLIMDAAPKQLLDQLNMTRKALTVQGKPCDQLVYDATAVVVSLNPDVVIVSVGEWKPLPLKPGEPKKLFWAWDQKEGRWQIVRKALEPFNYWLGNFGLYAGPLVPWTEEMYAFSTDPGVGFRRLNFENGEATVTLPKGKLVLRRRDIDVDVSRE